MGSYIAQADLNIKNDMLIYITDETNDPPTTIDTSVVSARILEAEGLLDGYIGVKNTLPLDRDAVTPFVKKLANDITIYFLWERSKHAVPPQVETSYLGALSHARDIANGSLVIGGITEFVAEDSAKSLTTSYDRS